MRKPHFPVVASVSNHPAWNAGPTPCGIIVRRKSGTEPSFFGV